MTAVKLTDVAELNPALNEGLAADDRISFVPMSAVSDETASVVRAEERTYGEVSKGYTPFLNGDILVAKITPCFENGKIAQATLGRRIGFGSTEFHVVRPRKGSADARFLLHFLRQDWVRREGERKMTGSAGQRRVPAHFLANLDLPRLPLAEQQRIAGILDRADALRAQRRAALATLDALPQAIFAEMFGDPRRPGAHPVAVLSECAEVVSGVAKGRKLADRVTVTVPYLRVANVQAGYLDSGEIKTIEALPDEVSELRLQPGDVVMTEGGDYDKLGRGALWEGQVADCIHQNHVFRVRAEASRLSPRYFHDYLQTEAARSYFLRCAKRTTNLASINMTQLRALPVVLPPLALQQDFARWVGAVEQLRSAHRESLAKLDELFGSLQHRAFRGEL